MINTVNIKEQQLKTGYFKSGSGPDVILIMGSCRVAPYCNYLEQWNEQSNNRFTICTLDPFNFNWNAKDERVDYNEALTAQESNVELLGMLKSVKYFVHEYYANAGMFNCNKEVENNIYKYGINPEVDITIPNFNDLFILVGDIVSFDIPIRKMAIQDYNVLGKLSEQTLKEIYAVRDKNLDKFYEICKKTSFQEFEAYFKASYKRERFFWNSNHVSKRFTLEIFGDICRKVGILYSNTFINSISEYDMFANNYTHITEYDDVNWAEPRKPIKDYLL